MLRLKCRFGIWATDRADLLQVLSADSGRPGAAGHAVPSSATPQLGQGPRQDQDLFQREPTTGEALQRVAHGVTNVAIDRDDVHSIEDGAITTYAACSVRKCSATGTRRREAGGTTSTPCRCTPSFGATSRSDFPGLPTGPSGATIMTGSRDSATAELGRRTTRVRNLE